MKRTEQQPNGAVATWPSSYDGDKITDCRTVKFKVKYGGLERSHSGLVRLLVPDLFERSVASTITNRNPAYGGGLAEWFKAHAWKACGRNPS